MKIAVGISGGVDSAVAAMLLKNQGHELLGVTMTLGREGEEKSVAEAREVASRLGLELKVFDFSREWKKNVVDYIRETYLAGATPNPCVRCNETVKLSLLPEAAFSAGCDFFATGHYARVENARIFRAADKFKDQSYFLCRVRRQVLEKLILPLGAYTKDEVRAMAKDFGFAAAGRADSQDFCGGDAVALVGEGERQGNIVTLDGRILGRHRGYWNYTIGKRKGLGIGGGIPYYVARLDAEKNEVVVAHRQDVSASSFEIGDYLGEEVDAQEELFVKVRSAGEPKGPVRLEAGRVLCPQGMMAVALGQSAVFYRGDMLVGSGIIR
jgi:tRNA-specific 2-thiouridylase